MRVAPVGLFFPQGAYEIGCLSAKITHGHIDGYSPAGFLAEMVSQMVHHNLSIMGSIEATLPHLNTTSNTYRLIQKALRYANEGSTDFHDRISMIGEGWTGDEALAIAIYCALVADDDFELGLLAAVNHGGDTDSTGAIYGNIIGASGVKIPSKWIDDLELSDLIKGYALKLYDVAKRRAGEEPYSEKPIDD